MLPLSEVRVLDRNAEALGVPTSQLMENAGRALAEHAAPVAGAAGVLVLAGPGNNGGDGLVAARHLASMRVSVEVMTPISPGGWRTDLARAAFGSLPPQVPVRFEATPEQVEAAMAKGPVVLDALLGAGTTGELREPYRGFVRALAKASATTRVVAVDVPTGFGTSTTYAPRETVTFHDAKEGMSEAACGRIRVVDIGIPRDATRYTGPGEYELYPQGRPEQHKGEGGIVLVIGGGPYTGAPAVCGMAALRAGADLAIVLTPQRAWSVVASYSPNLVVRPLNGDDLNFDDPANRVTLNTWLKKADSVVIGPGVGLFGQTQKAVHHALDRAAREGMPVVVDADALTAIAERKDLVTPRTLLTPHAREYRTLTGRDVPNDDAGREKAALSAAQEFGGTWLVKGPVDAVSNGERVKLNATGHPAMSVGGTGDALSGVVGAMLAKGLSPFDAARVGARLTGEAGERAAARKSWGLVATDVVEAIPEVLASALPRARRHS